MMNFGEVMIRKQQLVDQVIEHLSNMIAAGTYSIGGKLPTEPKLTEALGVGRSTLREAIRVLAHNGVLEVRQGDGTYIRALPSSGEPLKKRLKRAKLEEVQAVRRTLELEIARLAAINHKKADLKLVHDQLKLRKAALAANDIPALLDSDIAFHCALAAATGNAVLADLYRTFALSLREALTTLWDASDHDQTGMAVLHDHLYKAVEARDAAKAVSITLALLDRHKATLVASDKERMMTDK
jgi:GntR family transcriptional repressor for pyruvate dehydrogenase complex